MRKTSKIRGIRERKEMINKELRLRLGRENLKGRKQDRRKFVGKTQCCTLQNFIKKEAKNMQNSLNSM